MINELAIFSVQFRDAMKLQFETADKKPSEIIEYKGNKMDKNGSELSYLSSLCHDMLEFIEAKSNLNDLTFLHRVNTFAYQITNRIKQAESISENLKDVAVNVCFCPSSISANFLEIKHGPIVGAIRVNEQRLVIVIDKRSQDQPVIRLSCVSCKNTALTYWSHSIESEYLLGFGNKLPRVVVHDVTCYLLRYQKSLFYLDVVLTYFKLKLWYNKILAPIIPLQ